MICDVLVLQNHCHGCIILYTVYYLALQWTVVFDNVINYTYMYLKVPYFAFLLPHTNHERYPPMITVCVSIHQLCLPLVLPELVVVMLTQLVMII